VTNSASQPMHDVRFLYDLKTLDDARHKEVTGVSNRRILDNLQRLAEIHDNIWIRIPLIPGINDNLDNLDATAAFVAKLPGTHPVNLLPYHATGRHKFSRVGLSSRMHEAEPHTRDLLDAALKHFKRRGIPANVVS